MQKTTTDSILIAANIPEFKNQGVLWFQENETKIKSLSAKNSWWRNHIRLIAASDAVNPMTLMRDLSDMGYAKVTRVLNHGEFAFMGAVLSLWPINLENPIALDFDGNLIEEIRNLEIPKTRLSLASRLSLDKFDEIYTRFKPGDYVEHVDH